MVPLDRGQAAGGLRSGPCAGWEAPAERFATITAAMPPHAPPSAETAPVTAVMISVAPSFPSGEFVRGTGVAEETSTGGSAALSVADGISGGSVPSPSGGAPVPVSELCGPPLSDGVQGFGPVSAGGRTSTIPGSRVCRVSQSSMPPAVRARTEMIAIHRGHRVLGCAAVIAQSLPDQAGGGLASVSGVLMTAARSVSHAGRPFKGWPVPPLSPLLACSGASTGGSMAVETPPLDPLAG